MIKFNRLGLIRYAVSVFFLLTAILKLNAQPGTPVTADPALGSFGIFDLSGNLLDANVLHQDSYYLVKLQIRNLDQANAIPAGTAKVIVNLGVYFILDPAFNILTEPTLLENFTWGLEQLPEDQIYGIVHTALPDDYSGLFTMRVKANLQGTSTVSGNFVISNNNPLFVLSDANSGNNSAYVTYTILPPIPLPVSITKFTAINNNCTIKANWSSENEQNLSRYEVEVSKDGTTFVKMGSVSAENKTDYSCSFALNENLNGPSLQVRLKSIDLDGSFKYSNIIAVQGICKGELKSGIYCYPNPAKGGGLITIALKNSLFNGNYQLTLTDVSGKVAAIKKVALNNVQSFKFDISNNLTAGKYFIVIRNEESQEKSMVQFEKL